MYLQEDNDFDVPLSLDFQQTGISFAYGKELSDKPDRYLENYQLSFSVNWEKILIKHKYFHLTGHTEFNIYRWYSTDEVSLNPDGFIYSITPVFTYTFNDINILNHNPYLETGIGLAFMDSTQVENREKSTHFQFTDSIGLGFTSKSYKIGYRFTHISNLDIENPNPSIDLHQILISYKF